MLKKTWARAIVFLLIILVSRFLIVKGLDLINVNRTHYIEASNNQVILENSEDVLSTIDNLKSSDGRMTFSLEPDDQIHMISIRPLLGVSSISVDNQVIYQTTELEEPAYSEAFGYLNLEIKDKQEISIEADKFNRISVFVAPQEVFENTEEIRLVFFVFKFVILLFLTASFVFMYINRKSEKYFLVLVVIGLVSIVKSIGLGEIPVLTGALGINSGNADNISNATTFINAILPPLIIFDLFEMKVSKSAIKYIAAISAGIIGLIVIDFYKYYPYIFVGLSALVTGIVMLGAAKRKKFYQIIVANSIFYFGFAAYRLYVEMGIMHSGILNYYTHTAFIGALIYMSVFAIVLLNRYRQRIQEAEEMRLEYERVSLLRGISHDLRLPLSVIKISSQMIESGKLQELATRQYAKDITKEVLSIEKMTANINAYLKLGHRIEEEEVSDISKVCRQIERTFSKLYQDKCINFRVECECQGQMLKMGEMDLHRLLYNLLENAYKYSNADGQIFLKCSCADRCEITVEDTGIGMDDETLGKMMDPFYRYDQSRSIDGLGLGMSVVKEIVEYYGGEISIKSKIDKGTSIRLKF